MSNISETIIWEPSINQIESGEIIKGGSNGIVNLATKQLANRTQFLNKAIDDVNTDLTNRINQVDTTTNLKIDQINNDLTNRLDNFVAMEWTYQTGSYSVTKNSEGIFADTSTSSWTLILKANPSIGDTVCINDAAGSWGTNNLIVARNGERINGANEDFVCDVDYSTIRFVYCNNIYGWKLTI